MKMDKTKYIRKWRIINMEMWNQDFIDMITPGYFLFDQDGLGHFQFGSVEGHIDYRIEKINGVERLDFSWEGQAENDPASGRGWAILNDDYLEGRFYFHLGDDSWFKAKRMQ